MHSNRQNRPSLTVGLPMRPRTEAVARFKAAGAFSLSSLVGSLLSEATGHPSWSGY